MLWIISDLGKAGSFLPAFVDSLFDLIERARPRRMIIDLRMMTRGSDGFQEHLMPRLLESHLISRGPGRIIALVGPRTLSSGTWALASLVRDANAVVIGEPTGQGINHFGNTQTLQALSIGSLVYSSSALIQIDESKSNRRDPDIRVPRWGSDYFEGRDPALEEALSLPLPVHDLSR